MEKFKLNQINVDPMPNVEGVSFRYYQGKEDHPAMIDLYNCIHEDAGLEERETQEQFDITYSSLRNCNPQKDIILCEIDGKLVSAGKVSWAVETDGKYLYPVSNMTHPDWLKSEIATAVQNWVEKRARQIAAEHPADAPKFFEIWVSKTETEKIEMITATGFEVERYFYDMTCDLSEPIEVTPMPEGLEVKLVTPENYRKLWDASVEAFHDHWGDTEYTEEDFQRFLKRIKESPVYDPEMWMVGWEGEEIAGMVLNKIFAEENKALGIQRGYTDPICVRRPWRKRGLASALISRSLVLLKEKGMAVAALGVDTENPSGALGLYQRHGFRPAQEFRVYRKPL